ncbi:MAG: hypothetical protein M2R45_01312 [Verrucomicrobia subdivision 3 bacterium]|nr:hypothetical protein [Limisphaerales bacterium]MCS1415178.1 hypothetical protein [Limisphaerales bacterium]
MDISDVVLSTANGISGDHFSGPPKTVKMTVDLTRKFGVFWESSLILICL